jgi:DNA transposition AAA+ family ATPase
MEKEETAQLLRAEVVAYLETDPDASQNRIARAIGKSPATVNAWIHGSYRGDMSKLNGLIRVFMDRLRERANRTRATLDFVHTTASR